MWYQPKIKLSACYIIYFKATNRLHTKKNPPRNNSE